MVEKEIVSIPKIIHYCWLSSDPMPKELQQYMSTWKDKLPGYEFMKWDFKRFPKTQSEWVSEAFDMKKYAFACDYIRLYAVYNYGGIYMDMDMEVIKAFDDLLNRDYFFAVERPKQNYIEAGCFGAKPKNDFLGKCLEHYKDRKFIMENDEFDMTPLPHIMKDVMQKYQFNYTLLDWQCFTAKSYENGIEMPNENTYTIHHFAGSWKSLEEKALIEEAQLLSRKYGRFVGTNYVQFKEALRKEGIKGVFLLFKRKFKSKFLNNE